MELIKQHILPQLNSFINETRNSLDNIITEIPNDSSPRFTEIICYLEQILNLYLLSSNSSLTSLHIHFENEFDDSQKLLLGEYLAIKIFKYYYSNDKQINDSKLPLLELKAVFESKLKNLENKCPEGAKLTTNAKTKIRQPNEIWKKWLKDIEDIRILLDFYKSLNEKSSFKPKSIFNLQKNIFSSLYQKFEFRPYTKSIDINRESYNLVNATKTLREIDKINNQLIDELDAIILFDCERKRLMTNFSFEEITKWNKDYDTRFTKYLIITFGKDFSNINHTRNKIELIRERFKIPTNTTYTIAKSEINSLLNRKENAPLSIKFYGYESSSFWDSFVLETSIRGLYELRSIKLMNIYSICYNEEIKNYIMCDLFSKMESSELVSPTTKMVILELRDDDIEVLKEALSNTLDVIINSGIKSKVADTFINTQAIILDDAIIRNQKLQSKIRVSLGLTNSIKFNTWSDLINSDLNEILILSYRDQGRYPNYYFPNLLELELNSESIARVILPSFLFKDYYNWSKYSLLKEYHKLLTHPIRENNFEWVKLKNKIQELKPEKKLGIDWELENTYSITENRESYKVKLSGQRAKLYHSSDFIIYSDTSSEVFRIQRIKWFFENIDCEDSKYKIQKLDELLDDFNPAEKLIDTSQQEIELQIIRNQLSLENESAGRIWKILLNKKAELIGIDTLYTELLQLFSNNNIPLVKQSYFISSWLNTQNDALMPRGNKIVKVLFDYLQLSNEYRRILYRLKNASISGKIEATRKYSNLLKDLFSDGCFDSNANLKLIIQNKLVDYMQNHSLEELGIDSENPINGLVALIELIKPEIKTVELETIEKNNNE